jgi:hypothetical protein
MKYTCLDAVQENFDKQKSKVTNSIELGTTVTNLYVFCFFLSILCKTTLVGIKEMNFPDSSEAGQFFLL